MPSGVGVDGDVTSELDEARELQVQECQNAAAKIARLIHYRQRCQHEAAVRWGQRHSVSDEQRLIARQEADRAAVREISGALRQSEQTTLGVLNSAQFYWDHMPRVWATFRDGILDLARLRKITTIGSGVQSPANLARLDEAAAACAGDRTVGELRSWLNRYIAALDQEEFSQQCAQAREARCVRFFHREDGMSEIWALVPTIAAAIEKQLHRAARAGGGQAGGDTGAPESAARESQLGDDGVGKSQVEDSPAGDGTSGDSSVGTSRVANSTVRDSALSGAGEHTPADLAALLTEAVGFAPPAGPFSEDADTEEAIGTAESVGSPIRSDHTADQQTVTQREADLFVSWLTGCAGDQSAPSAKIAVMIPVTTLTGESEEPGVSADRQWSLPAEQTRELAARTGARHDWYSLYYLEPPGQSGGTRDPNAEERSEDDPLIPENLLAIRYEGHDPPPKLCDALIFRDGTCQAPGCTVATDRCDLDHQQPWPRGPTTAENLKHLCRRHHRQKSHGHLSPTV